MKDFFVMNAGVLILCGILFVLFLYATIKDAVKPTPVSKPVYKNKPRARLELIYKSVTTGLDLFIPVQDITHARKTIELLSLEDAQVGYRRSTDGKTVVLYAMNEAKELRRIKEVV